MLVAEKEYKMKQKEGNLPKLETWQFLKAFQIIKRLYLNPATSLQELLYL